MAIGPFQGSKDMGKRSAAEDVELGQCDEIYSGINDLDPNGDPLGYSRVGVEDTPEGYPRLGRFLASADDFYVYREFRYLQSRVLLYLQDDLRALETQLWRMDSYDRQKRPEYLKSREVDDMCVGGRKALMLRIKNALREYGDFLSLSGRLAGLEKPSSFDLNSIQNFFSNFAPLAKSEVFIGNTEDMVTLKAGRDDAWLDQIILRLLVKFHCGLLRCIFTPPGLAKLAGRNTVLYSARRVRALKLTILIGAMLLLLCGPTIPLYDWSQQQLTLSTQFKILGLQIGCTLAVGIILSIGTRAKKHEIFTACAGYMAILVVFMGSSQGNGANDIST